ncbi:MAG TPA: dTDP-4-dehydrorhamnose reductase [Chthoniobacterales bacterium]
MARILIIGSGGRLGGALKEIYSTRHKVIGLDRKALDFSDLKNVRRTIADQPEFDVAINCAALTNVDYCETHREEAFTVNAEAVRVAAEAVSERSAQLIHISTDYVFDGAKTGSYAETDEVTPISVYGESKRAGEIALLEVSPDHLAARVSWVFGPHRPSFVDMMLKRAATDEKVSAIADKDSTPSYTLDLAAMIEPFFIGVRAGGVLHLCNSGFCTWREYAQHALDVALAIGLPLKATHVDPIPLDSLKAFVARRPRNTVMSTARFTALTGQTPRPWQEAVREYVTTYGRRIVTG